MTGKPAPTATTASPNGTEPAQAIQLPPVALQVLQQAAREREAAMQQAEQLYQQKLALVLAGAGLEQMPKNIDLQTGLVTPQTPSAEPPATATAATGEQSNGH